MIGMMTTVICRQHRATATATAATAYATTTTRQPRLLLHRCISITYKIARPPTNLRVDYRLACPYPRPAVQRTHYQADFTLGVVLTVGLMEVWLRHTTPSGKLVPLQEEQAETPAKTD